MRITTVREREQLCTAQAPTSSVADALSLACLPADNPFHCFQHAFMIMHACWLFLTDLSVRNGLLEEIDCLALLLAAVCHDLEHPGTTNAFQARARFCHAARAPARPRARALLPCCPRAVRLLAAGSVLMPPPPHAPANRSTRPACLLFATTTPGETSLMAAEVTLQLAAADLFCPQRFGASPLQCLL
jgi:hypothetical protein